MSASEAGDKSKTHIDLEKLSIEQLAQIKQEMEQEISNIQDSLQTLYNCKGKYATSKEALEAFQPDWENREILVPLTSSMYVPGRIKTPDNFIIDIGTGYYIEKNLDGSKDYFVRRVQFVQEQIEKIEKIRIERSHLLNAISNTIEIKQIAAAKLIQQKQTA